MYNNIFLKSSENCKKNHTQKCPPQKNPGVSKSTVVRGEDAFPSGSVRVTDCRDTTLYLLAPMQYCNVQVGHVVWWFDSMHTLFVFMVFL